jgi:hypothetical protein
VSSEPIPAKEIGRSWVCDRCGRGFCVVGGGIPEDQQHHMRNYGCAGTYRDVGECKACLRDATEDA